MEVEIFQLAWLARGGWYCLFCICPNSPGHAVRYLLTYQLRCNTTDSELGRTADSQTGILDAAGRNEGLALQSPREGASSLLAAEPTCPEHSLLLGRQGKMQVLRLGEGPQPRTTGAWWLLHSSSCFKAVSHRKGHSKLLLLHCATAASGYHNH